MTETPVRITRQNNALVVTIDSPPVNAIGLQVRQGLQSAIERANMTNGIDRVLLTGNGKMFAAGGDAREFDAPPIAPHLPDIVDAIENSKAPWIACITGAALGGGCELLLGCRYRIATTRAKLGMPEVKLGVIPGASGTQRLPRLIGIERALSMISEGNSISAAASLDFGLVDEISDDPIERALTMKPSEFDTITKVGSRVGPTAQPEAVAQAQKRAKKRMPGQVAPKMAIDLIDLATHVPLKEALRLEREVFLSLRQGEQAQALRHLFFAERAAMKCPVVGTATPNIHDRVAVIGGGTMGAGIAYAFLKSGVEVILLERDHEAAGAAKQRVEKLLLEGQLRGILTTTQAETLWHSFRTTTEYEQLSSVSLVVEAAYESMEVKREIFGELERHLPRTAILATNTSYLDLDVIAQSTDDPSRVLGLHFFAPAEKMKLLEVVRGAQTSDQAIIDAWHVAKTLGKTPVLAGVCDGFIGNRLLQKYREAADDLLVRGATIEQIDNSMRAFGYPMGPYEAQDLSGLDIAYANRQRQATAQPRSRDYVRVADRLVEAGRLGRKTGAGWYIYDASSEVHDPELVSRLCIEEAERLGVRRTDMSATEISDHLVEAIVNEASLLLAEGIAQSASDIDLVLTAGYGFPRWRGGPMFFAGVGTSG